MLWKDMDVMASLPDAITFLFADVDLLDEELEG
jgi:hypothetical protein